MLNLIHIDPAIDPILSRIFNLLVIFGISAADAASHLPLSRHVLKMESRRSARLAQGPAPTWAYPREPEEVLGASGE